MTRPRDIIALILQRSPRMPPFEEEMGYWKAFLSLRRQGWHAHPDDERSIRWSAGIGSGLVHAVFFLVLLGMAYSQWYVPPYPPRESEQRVRVGFSDGMDAAAQSGNRTQGAEAGAGDRSTPSAPDTVVARPPEAQTASVPPVTAPVTALPVVVPSPVSAPPPLPEVIQRSIPEPVRSAANQPVQVTEVETPTTEYVLTPTFRTPEVSPPDVPQTSPPDIQVRQREIVPIHAPAVTAPTVPTVAAPTASAPQVREREIAAPVTTARVPRIEVPSVTAPPLRLPDSHVRPRDAASPTPAADVSASVPEPGNPPVAGAVPSPVAPARQENAASTSGERDRWQRAANDDRWGDTARGSDDRAAAGVFDGDGRVRLPGEGDTDGRPRGAPGGDNDEWTQERIARSGTWLQSPPSHYTPGRFDAYWVPHESLLAEWVRKGIKSLSIPIPGTGKRIQCVISILQVGGGCGISDPNLNVQPAQARPPPEVPFKPGLQEDNGSATPAVDDVWR